MDEKETDTPVQVVTNDEVVKYQVFALPDANQAESLANYLTRHGHDSAQVENEVTCPTTTLAETAEVWQMLNYWKLFWRYSEKELYGLPAYVKPACKEHR